MKYFLLKAYDGGSKVISNGSGGKFLADDGTYKTIDVSGSGLTIEQVEAINHVLSDYNNGKVMSAENFTTTLKNKLDSLNGERDLEMRANTTHLQWRYVGDTVWNNIASLDELRGFTVNIGETGQVLTKKSNTSGDWEFRQLDKTDIGLSNVQNVDTTDIDNINESTTKKIMTDAERTKLSNAFVKGTDTTDSLMEGLTKLLLTTAERDKLNNLSGTNTGDQDLSGLVQKTTTINGNPLSSNVEIPLIDTIVSEGTGTSILRTKTGNTQNIKGISGDDSITIVDDVANKNIQVAVNEAGLLYDNIPDGTLYKKVSVGKFDEITHTNRTALDSVSGVNTGDETKTTIEAKLTGNITSHTHSYEPTITAGTTSQYYRGDKTFQTLNKAAVGLSNVTNDAQIKKITSSVNDNIVTFGAATGDTVKDSGKSINNIAFKNEVNTFTKDITINGTLQVSGNIVQNGESYETHSEQVYTKDNTIILRDGAVSGLGAGEYAGFTAKSYDGTNDGQLVFDKDGVARVGDIGSTQAIATREETPSNGNVAIWDSTSSKFITSTGNTGTGSIVRANSPTFTGTVNGITPTMVGLGNVKNLDTSNPANITWAASYRTVTDTEKTAWNGKQNALGYTAENSANKKTAWQTTPDNTSYPSEKLVKDNLDLKVDKVTGKQLSTEDYTTAEKTKLSGIESGANNYVHPSTHSADMITENTNKRFVTDAEKTTWNSKANTTTATQSTNGLMSSTDKTKLDGIASGANNYTHPTGDGNSHIPATGTTNNGKVLKAGSTANSVNWGTVDWNEVTNKPASMPASDVYAWAKSEAKPTYTFAEIGSCPTTIAGYGITDGALQGVAYSNLENNVKIVQCVPQGGKMYLGAGAQTGAIKIKLPKNKTNTMFKFHVRINGYSPGGKQTNSEYVVKGLSNSLGFGATIDAAVTCQVTVIKDNASAMNSTFYFCTGATEDYILIGEITDTHNSKSVVIDSVEIHHVGISDDWSKNWAISLVTTLETLTSQYKVAVTPSLNATHLNGSQETTTGEASKLIKTDYYGGQVNRVASMSGTVYKYSNLYLGQNIDLKTFLILLTPVWKGEIVDASLVRGKFHFDRGTTFSSNVTRYAELDIRTAYNANNLRSFDSDYMRFGTVAYNGTTYYCIYFSGTAQPMVINFEGYFQTTDTTITAPRIINDYVNNAAIANLTQVDISKNISEGFIKRIINNVSDLLATIALTIKKTNTVAFDVENDAGTSVFTVDTQNQVITGSAVDTSATANKLVKRDANGAITNSQYKLSALNTAPASATAIGTTGEIRIDANYIYVCTATNSWKRTALTTW